MPQYMVEFDLPVPFSDEVSLLVPEQRKVLEDLIAKSKLNSYSISLEASKMWCIFNGNGVDEINDLIDDFPMKDYMPFAVHELFFNRMPINFIPSFSLN